MDVLGFMEMIKDESVCFRKCGIPGDGNGQVSKSVFIHLFFYLTYLKENVISNQAKSLL